MKELLLEIISRYDNNEELVENIDQIKRYIKENRIGYSEEIKWIKIKKTTSLGMC